jgi:hypothetical protein
VTASFEFKLRNSVRRFTWNLTKRVVGRFTTINGKSASVSLGVMQIVFTSSGYVLLLRQTFRAFFFGKFLARYLTRQLARLLKVSRDFLQSFHTNSEQ